MAAGSSAPELFTSVIGKRLAYPNTACLWKKVPLTFEHRPFVSDPVFSVQVYLSPKEMWEWAQS